MMSAYYDIRYHPYISWANFSKAYVLVVFIQTSSSFRDIITILNITQSIRSKYFISYDTRTCIYKFFSWSRIYTFTVIIFFKCLHFVKWTVLPAIISWQHTDSLTTHIQVLECLSLTCNPLGFLAYMPCLQMCELIYQSSVVLERFYMFLWAIL